MKGVPIMATINITKENFNKEIKESKNTVLIDFFANWCGPCKMLSPVIDEISEELPVKVAKVNIDDQPEIASQFGVMSIPTVIVMKNGEIINKSVGYRPKKDILAMID